MLRGVLWAAIGAVSLPAAAFGVLVVLIGAVDICAPYGGKDGGREPALGFAVLLAAPVGAVVFWWLSLIDLPSRAAGPLRFGRMTKPSGRGNDAEPKGRA